MLNYNKLMQIISVLQWFLGSCSWSGALLFGPFQKQSKQETVTVMHYRQATGD